MTNSRAVPPIEPLKMLFTNQQPVPSSMIRRMRMPDSRKSASVPMHDASKGSQFHHCSTRLQPSARFSATMAKATHGALV